MHMRSMTASEIRQQAGFRPIRPARQQRFHAAADLRLALALFGESALLYPAAAPAATALCEADRGVK
ncbi:hypothetical protein LG3211_1880 [Lysobacter gummosus]|jgi:hypothetical protein|nr:hypothetical protein LG3211_1880 [Lysobacter gummosus]